MCASCDHLCIPPNKQKFIDLNVSYDRFLNLDLFLDSHAC